MESLVEGCVLWATSGNALLCMETGMTLDAQGVPSAYYRVREKAVTGSVVARKLEALTSAQLGDGSSKFRF